MKAVNIIGIVLVFALIALAGYYIDTVSSARWAGWFSDYDYYGSYGSSYYGPDANELSVQAALFTLVFILFYTFGYIGNLVKVKTVTSKVMCIIGLSLTFITLLIDMGTLSSPGSMSYDETGGVFIIYAIINLAFFIVLLVQSVQYGKKGNNSQKSQEVLDIEIE